MSTELLTRCRDFRNVWKKHGPGSLCPCQRNGARLCRRPAAARGKFEGVGSLQRAAVGRGRHGRAPARSQSAPFSTRSTTLKGRFAPALFQSPPFLLKRRKQQKAGGNPSNDSNLMKTS